MDQWQAYADPSSSSRRYNGTSQSAARDYNNGQTQSQPPAGYKYDQYQGGLTPQQSQGHALSSNVGSQNRDGNGDVAMQDAHDPYANRQYPLRPHHQQHLSSSGRPSALHSPSESSSAAQRYSPMEVMAPTSPYAPKTPGSSSQYGQNPAQQRASPTRPEYQPSQSHYFNRQQQQSSQQMQPVSPYVSTQDGYPSSAVAAMDGPHFANDPKSPRRFPQQPTAPVRGPVPEFKKVRVMTDLRPKVNSQPPFRRANPEGGFISVRIVPHLVHLSTRRHSTDC